METSQGPGLRTLIKSEVAAQENPFPSPQPLLRFAVWLTC